MRAIGESGLYLKHDEALFALKIGEFPRLGSPIKDKNGADVYRLPKGVSVVGCDPVTGKGAFYPVEALTVEDNCKTVKVTASDRSVIVSDNESMAVFDQTTGALTKVAPADLKGKLVPLLKKNPSPFGTFGDADIGWLVGSLISDGWVSNDIVGYSKMEDAKRQKVEEVFRRINPNFLLKEYVQAGEKRGQKLGDAKKIHIYSHEIAEIVRKFDFIDKTASLDLKAACRKQISKELLTKGSEDFMWGLLSGLIDGDGSIVKNTSKAKPRFTCRYSTSSEALRDSFAELLYRLGIRYSITTVPPRNWSKEAYIICPSSIDIYKNIDKIKCYGEREVALLEEWKQYAPDYVDKLDQVPVSDAEWETLKAVCNSSTDASTYSTCMKKGCTRHAMRANLKKYDEFTKEHIPSLYNRVHAEDTIWSTAEVTEDTGMRQVFDLMVTDAKVFAVNSGFIIWDTVNLHVPVSKRAIEDIR